MNIALELVQPPLVIARLNALRFGIGNEWDGTAGGRERGVSAVLLD